MKGRPEEYFILFSKSFMEFNLGKTPGFFRDHSGGAGLRAKIREHGVCRDPWRCLPLHFESYRRLFFRKIPRLRLSPAVAHRREPFPRHRGFSQLRRGGAGCASHRGSFQTVSERHRAEPGAEAVTLALVAMRAGKNDEALGLLEPARRIELGAAAIPLPPSHFTSAALSI